MKALVTQFGHGVREIRESKGWSQETLAEKADLNRSYVGDRTRRCYAFIGFCCQNFQGTTGEYVVTGRAMRGKYFIVIILLEVVGG
jgi:hypothetical protein